MVTVYSGPIKLTVKLKVQPVKHLSGIFLMHIVVIAWIYVVFMMSLTEHSVIGGILTFLLYGVFPLAVILYITGTGQRKRKRAAAEKTRREAASPAATATGDKAGSEPT
jgi:bacteriorhodopsin